MLCVRHTMCECIPSSLSTFIILILRITRNSAFQFMTNVRSRLFSIRSNDGSRLEITLLWFFWYSLCKYSKTNPWRSWTGIDWQTGSWLNESGTVWGLPYTGGLRATGTTLLWFVWYSLRMESPNCLQTTVASLVSQWSSHTVPQVSLKQISTLPSLDTEPPTSLRSPSLQTMTQNYVT